MGIVGLSEVSVKFGDVLALDNLNLKIDQGEGFSFALDKVDELQSDIKLMSTWAEDAAQQMKQHVGIHTAAICDKQISSPADALGCFLDER